jgi:hypothetical protein
MTEGTGAGRGGQRSDGHRVELEAPLVHQARRGLQKTR